MNEPQKLGEIYWKELEAEATATRKCLERVPDDKFGWKPHERSMEMGRLAYTTASIPRWIARVVEDGEINFGTFKQDDPKTAAELAALFDRNMEEAKRALMAASDDDLRNNMFSLKAGEKLLMSMTKQDAVSSSINHMVHHRGQLTVYLRLCDVPVPEIYGPSADEGKF